MSFSDHADPQTDVQHNDSAPLRQKFGCTQCSKTFNRSENLKRHVASHEAGKHCCVVCGKNFTRSDLLKRHRKSHARSTSISSKGRPETMQQMLPVERLEPHPIGFVPVLPTLETSHDQIHTLPVDGSHPEMSLDNFMSTVDNSGLSIGSFDGDIAWTLDFACSHPFMSLFSGDYLTPSTVDYTGIDTGAILDAADHETGEWPDRISRPASPKGQRPVRALRTPIDWTALSSECQQTKALYQPADTGSMAIDRSTREGLIQFLSPPLPQPRGFDFHMDNFPPVEILEHFLLLYFRHIHQRFPVIHLPTFVVSKISPVLLMGMILTGSSHSVVDKTKFVKYFYKNCQSALMRNVEASPQFLRSVDNIHGLLLVCVTGTWSGDRESYEFAEGFRGVLVTASRRCRLLDCRSSPAVDESHKGVRVLDQIWHSWIEIEKRKRLGLTIYLYDCQYPALFNNQPYVSKSETANSVLPCPEEYWSAKTSDIWKMLIGPANVPPSTFFIHALNSCLLEGDAPIPQRVDDFGRNLLLYALHTHIFEWRQAISMLNPNGFANMYGSVVLDIGAGLKDRRRWLLVSLENWHKCYYDLCSDPTIVLLYHLGYVSLDVSLSDLHLAAGRSGNRAEGEVAEQSLRNWANSDAAAITMYHVRQGFEVTYSVLETGTVLKGSFEMIMSLFTGGLVTWAYLKFRNGHAQDVSIDHIRRAASALMGLASWRISSLFGTILKDFDGT